MKIGQFVNEDWAITFQRTLSLPMKRKDFAKTFPRTGYSLL